ncbi:MAG: GNAT family N-acetyltransferase [Paracoccaceae bacterium]|nr:GNAT family N-acetyltransferase [Paracoccaceae bacterium]
MAIEVVPFREEFRQEVAQLLRVFWHDPDLSLAQFSWLVDENPYSNTPLVYLALSEGRVVSMRIFHAARWEVVGSGRSFDVPCGVAFVTDKDYRRRGIGALLMERAVDDMLSRGIKHLFSLAASPITFRVQEQQGWRRAVLYDQVSRSRPLRQWRRFIGRQLPLVRKILRRTRSQLAADRAAPKPDLKRIFAPLDSIGPITFEGGRLEITQVPDAAAMAALAATGRDAGRIRHVRGPDYFEWRYRMPIMEKRFLTWSQGDARGFLVLEARRDVKREIRIVDWEVTGDAVLKRLLAAVIKFGEFQELWTWRVGLPEELTDFLDQSGFKAITYDTQISNYSAGLMVKTLTDPAADRAWEIGGTNLLTPENWALRRAYVL